MAAIHAMPSGRYGRRHQRTRAATLPAVGPLTPCCRCGHPLWTCDVALDHNDSGEGYRGYAHASPCPVCRERCNQKAGGVHAAQLAGRRPRDRDCEACGKRYHASDSQQRTCGDRECVQKLRAANKDRTALPEPPPSNARPW